MSLCLTFATSKETKMYNSSFASSTFAVDKVSVDEGTRQECQAFHENTIGENRF